MFFGIVWFTLGCSKSAFGCLNGSRRFVTFLQSVIVMLLFLLDNILLSARQTNDDIPPTPQPLSSHLQRCPIGLVQRGVCHGHHSYHLSTIAFDAESHPFFENQLILAAYKRGRTLLSEKHRLRVPFTRNDGSILRSVSFARKDETCAPCNIFLKQ